MTFFPFLGKYKLTNIGCIFVVFLSAMFPIELYIVFTQTSKHHLNAEQCSIQAIYHKKLFTLGYMANTNIIFSTKYFYFGKILQFLNRYFRL